VKNLIQAGDSQPTEEW